MIRKRGRIYWSDFRITGKRIRRSLKTTDKIEALDRLKALRDAYIDRLEKKAVSFPDICKAYIEWAWSSKPASALREEQRLRKAQDYFIKQLKITYLQDIKPYHIEQFKFHLKEKKLAKGTINQYLQLLRRVFYKAIDWEQYDNKNPVTKVSFYKVNSHRDALSKKQLKKILDVAQKMSQESTSPARQSFPDLILIGLNTGMRRSEILNLRWKDVKEGEVLVRGKGDKRRVVPLNKTAKETIERQLRRNEYIFSKVRKLYETSIEWTVRKIRKETGINFHFHLLRHTFATKLLEKGVDIVTIASLLGHSKITMSLIYSHTTAERKRKAVEVLDTF